MQRLKQTSRRLRLLLATTRVINLALDVMAIPMIVLHHQIGVYPALITRWRLKYDVRIPWSCRCRLIHFDQINAAVATEMVVDLQSAPVIWDAMEFDLQIHVGFERRVRLGGFLTAEGNASPAGGNQQTSSGRAYGSLSRDDCRRWIVGGEVKVSSQGSYEAEVKTEERCTDEVAVCHVKRESEDPVSPHGKRGSRALTCRLAILDGCQAEHVKSVSSEKDGCWRVGKRLLKIGNESQLKHYQSTREISSSKVRLRCMFAASTQGPVCIISAYNRQAYRSGPCPCPSAYSCHPHICLMGSEPASSVSDSRSRSIVVGDSMIPCQEHPFDYYVHS
ncbi:hypothetical protein KC366_g12 [Hortaea werneckii]|nr:hypothetical protein KC366_g12 [Hortaea werneckii]